MSVFTGTSASPSPPENRQKAISNNGWFPEVDMELLRSCVRVPAGVTDARLVNATKDAILEVNNELRAWAAAQAAQGYADLAAVPGAQIDGEHELLYQYRRAVYGTVNAALYERYRDMDSTGAADKRADMLDPGIDEYRRNCHWAISAIINHRAPGVASGGHAHIDVELI